MNRVLLLVLLGGSIFIAGGCATAPTSQIGRDALQTDVQNTLVQLQGTDPSLKPFLDKSYGFVCYPSIIKGGFGVGGAYGRGEVFEQGNMIGYADLSQASIGFQIGGQSFTEIIAFQNPSALEQFTKGRTTFTANASAVAMKAGAAAATSYTDGVAVFIATRGGLMAEASIGGQSFTFFPVNGYNPALAPPPSAGTPPPQPPMMTPEPSPAPQSPPQPMMTPQPSPAPQPAPQQPSMTPQPAPQQPPMMAPAQPTPAPQPTTPPPPVVPAPQPAPAQPAAPSNNPLAQPSAGGASNGSVHSTPSTQSLPW